MSPAFLDESRLAVRAQRVERRAHLVSLLSNRALDFAARAVRMLAQVVAHVIEQREIRAGLTVGRIDDRKIGSAFEDETFDYERRRCVAVLEAVRCESRFRLVDPLDA